MTITDRRIEKHDNISGDEMFKKIKELHATKVDKIGRSYTADITDPMLNHLLNNTRKVTLTIATDSVLKAQASLDVQCQPFPIHSKDFML